MVLKTGWRACSITTSSCYFTWLFEVPDIVKLSLHVLANVFQEIELAFSYKATLSKALKYLDEAKQQINQTV